MSKKTKDIKKSQRPPIKKGTLLRIVKLLFSYFPVLLPITIVFILLSSAISSINSVFLQKIIAVIETWVESGDWNSAKDEVIPLVLKLVGLYAASLAMLITYTQLMAYITQSFIARLRKSMFNGMQNLPIKYFDTHKHGDIMSFYTNDIDTLRDWPSTTAFRRTILSGTAMNLKVTL